MKKLNFVVSVLITLVMTSIAMTAFAAQGKGGRGSGGWGMGGAYQRMYDPATIETVTGKVIAVERATPIKGMGTGIHLKLKTGQETLSVHLGPAWYIQRLDDEIKQGDTIEVNGSKVTVAGKPAIIAAQVKKGDALLTLRDNSGIPVWSGWRNK